MEKPFKLHVDIIESLFFVASRFSKNLTEPLFEGTVSQKSW
jgi:hypothetical protein